PGFRTITWNGLLAPAGTPKDIIDRIAREVARAVREPATIERLTKNGNDPLGNSPAEFAELIQGEAPLWRAAVEAAGIKQE
ncbi:MAG: tripartite tricarboxylate transporter substrate binding protein, partial [Betaproteobacteria bacterium]|nr:tripartite tricarboxylate transporter substrate binding protein [Betaproteobacteria bacterium]